MPACFAQTTEPTIAPRIIELRGDGAAIGDAHGRALGAEIRLLNERYLGKALTPAQRTLASNAAMLFEPFLQPSHLAEIKALSAASGVDERDAMLVNSFLDLTPSIGCSTIALPAGASQDHVARFARNLDFPAFSIADKYSVVLIYHPAGHYAFATIGWPGMIGALSGINERGLALANMEVPRSPALPHAMPYTLLYRTILERCANVDEALKLLKSTPRQSANNLMLMDAAGNRAVAEITPEQVIVRHGEKDAALISTNHQRGEDNDTAGKCPRYDILHDTARRDFGKIDLADLRSHAAARSAGRFHDSVDDL